MITLELTDQEAELALLSVTKAFEDEKDFTVLSSFWTMHNKLKTAVKAERDA